MSNYQETCKLGKLGEEHVTRFLVETYGGNIIPFISKEEQRFCGDFCWKRSETEKFFCEVKTEYEDKWENFFLEHWSNNLTKKVGWLQYSLADFLFYYFLKDKKLYVLFLKEIQKWSYEQENIFNFPLKKQYKNEQQNESYGYCVPIDVFRQLGQSVGFLEINLV